MDELKACMCGAKVEIRHEGNEHTKSRKSKIKCPDCGLEIRVGTVRHGFDWSDEQLTKKWNTRPIEDALQKRVEELEKTIRRTQEISLSY